MVRRSAVVVALAALVSTGATVPAAHAPAVDGTTSFTVAEPSSCTVATPTESWTAESTAGATGAHPAAVTVGEAITLDIARVYTMPLIHYSELTVQVRVSGPVRPNGDVDLNAARMLKATGVGTVTISLLGTVQYVPRTPPGPLAITCVPTSGNPLVLTTFVTTVDPVCFGLPATVVGSTGDDVLRGTSGPDVIVARGGDDVITGGDGDDVICGDYGNDRINAGAGHDRVDAGYANDVVLGSSGDDALLGGSGRDDLAGNTGSDRLDGGVGTDAVDGGTGFDWCTGEVRVSCSP